MHVDFKITAWERVFIPEGHEQEILDKIKSGEIDSANGVFETDLDCPIERLTETDEQMTPEENGGQCTLEVYKGTSTNSIYKNGR